ncbi:FMN-linked oxidoreductase [Microthyrium microscopicum]|uniref:FMN-linked oxidoreductase n=1 Tax=Microthyrium microscopicum TaxID=703497 RepID=A0A6A6UJH7_9PEZI|nr:FMN-linked oxidoreductase [Microthyrium microscopicum]
MNTSRLFQPMKVGNIELKHRIGLAPMSRLRASDSHVPTALMKEYYSQRAAVPGTLLVTEANAISPAAVGVPNGPGIWNDEQIAAWKDVVDEIHSKDSFIICQIAAWGRLAMPTVIEAEGIAFVAPSAIPIPGAAVPTPMTIGQINQTVQDFAQAARNAMAAGFDGIEFDGDNGLLIDQFTQDISNQRDDQYGGSIENRSRFSYEIVKAVAEAVGPKRVGFRMSPWSTFNGMRMKDPIPQFTDLITRLKSIGIAWISLIESRIKGDVFVEGTEHEKLDFAFEAWNGTVMVAGGYMPESARELLEKRPDDNILVHFGRPFITNPDLVFRVKEGLEFTHYNRSLFYAAKEPKGYTDYPFSKEYLKSIS